MARSRKKSREVLLGSTIFAVALLGMYHATAALAEAVIDTEWREVKEAGASASQPSATAPRPAPLPVPLTAPPGVWAAPLEPNPSAPILPEVAPEPPPDAVAILMQVLGQRPAELPPLPQPPEPPSDGVGTQSPLVGRQLPPPELLETPRSPAAPETDPASMEDIALVETPLDAPTGFTGPSGVLPREGQTDPHFVPMEDRWRIGFPEYDRYGKGHPPVDDYPFVLGHWWDPFNQNVLKGDYPIIGQNTFLEVTATSRNFAEYHEVPIPTTPFESTANPNSQPFFGRPNQFLYQHFFILSLDLFHGDAAFKPIDWRVKVTPIFNVNYLAGQELGIVNPDVRRSVDRGRTFMALQEWFVETKLADISPNYDFVSVRAGSQPFNSDFRGFIFKDTNRAVRLFGTRNSNREQFNIAFFAQQEKDTNSELNTFEDRHQRILIANYYVQDCIWPGYTSQVSMHYNRDDPTFKFDKNDFLVRPDPVGVFTPHGLDVVYVGWTGDGHINRLNINHAFYWALGRDSLNNIANQPQDISAQLAAVELSYDRDWIRFRTSFLWASGDRDPNNSHATGFDGIFENPNFAGGMFTYWQRQSVRLLGVNLVNRGSLFPDLRSSRIQGQSNFVNPGLYLFNVGADFEVTPKCRIITNVNPMWFDNTAVLKTFVFQERIRQGIGTDMSMGVEYRPHLNNNVIFTAGVAGLVPGGGFRDIYSNFVSDAKRPLLASFIDMALTY
jgi:hypothetical protein